MRIRTLVGIVILFAILGSIIYIIYDTRHNGKLSELSVLLILFLIVFFVGSSGISLTITHSYKLIQDIKNKATFLVTEGTFVRSTLVTGKGRNANGKDYSTFNHVYTYEYIVNGKRYEYADETGLHWNEEPKTEKDKKIIIRYNPENPEELIQQKANILGLFSGLLCLGVLGLIIFVLMKKGFEINDIFRILNINRKY